MKHALLCTAVASFALAVESRTCLSWLADTFIAKGVKPTFGYQEATLYLGIEKAYEYTQDDKYLDWLKSQIDNNVVQDNGSIKGWKNTSYVLDNYRMGNQYLYLYNETGDLRYKTAASIVREQLNSHPRTPSGGFWHGQSWHNQMWLDGLFMAQPFYAKWTNLFDKSNETAWADILNQYHLIQAHTLEWSGLLVHGWAEGPAPWADPKTGRAPHVWGRADGWYFMSLVEVLQVFPASHPGRAELMKYFRSLAAALVRSQDRRSGNWWQVMDAPYPGRPGNYIESSGSAMFTWGLLKGIRLGYLNRADYLRPAVRAYKGLYYISVPTSSNDYKGSGPYMLAAYEWETWASVA
ncbi:cell wall glycosyl hydrolase protein [Purpureocillium lilacinum]|uniref:Cell wall glycosyl hydrolase protein n=1 Tax=Purpureocillium lilacinum TaxID=33203 RepID=A0A179GDH3_PURLI|nr:cell wall glycosyl hydrolase protein [Purpureocillium lilacinum]OAQ75875.1 cell wall glycosyl hydrolase protein [Purpureocillium lilacinum]